MAEHSIPYDDRACVSGTVSVRHHGQWVGLDFTTGSGHRCDGHDLTYAQSDALLAALTDLRADRADASPSPSETRSPGDIR